MNENQLFNIIGKNVKYQRQLYNIYNTKLTQEQLAEKIGVSTALIGNLESDKIDQGISVITLYRLANFFNVPVDDFFKLPQKYSKKNTSNNN